MGTTRRLAEAAAVLACLVFPAALFAQTLTGTLICTVKDAQGMVRPAATVRISSAVLLGGSKNAVTDDHGQARFVE
jgi:hypothetical protein